MRAVGLGGDQASSVEGRRRAEAGGRGRRAAEGERAAHAVALHSGPRLLVRLRLGVEEGDEGGGVAHGGVGAERAGHRHDLGPVLRL